MSRIAKYPVALPSGTEATITAGSITVKGPLGSLTQQLKGDVEIKLASPLLQQIARVTRRR